MLASVWTKCPNVDGECFKVSGARFVSIRKRGRRTVFVADAKSKDELLQSCLKKLCGYSRIYQEGIRETPLTR